MDHAEKRAGAVLTIDLDGIAANWKRINDKVGPKAKAAGVVKANAYGLGVDRVAPALWAAGCRRFFVAMIDEGIELAALLPHAEVFVLSGPLSGTEDEFIHHALIPVLNSPEQIDRWAALAKKRKKTAPSAIHVDSGMSRLGLSRAELISFAENHETKSAVQPILMISHLVAADETDNPLTKEQRQRFEEFRQILPDVEASLAASSGVFVGEEFHYDWVRPGAALYGINPMPDLPNVMAPVVRLSAKILQVRDVEPGMSVGYGATHRVLKKGRVAVIAAGYADGLLRSISNRALGFINGQPAPLVGRASMDLITFDVSAVSEYAREGEMIDLISKEHSIDDLAKEAETIGYELLTSLGARYHRVYVGGPKVGEA